MKRNLNLLSTECNHIAKNKMILITLNESNEKKIQRQSIAIKHEIMNAMKLTAMIFHQVDVVKTNQKFA